MARNQTEFRLQCAVADMLGWAGKPGLIWFHPANGENRSAITGARLKRMGVKPGVADLILLWDGTAIALELKPEKGGRQQDSQKAFAEAWEAAGGVYFLAKGYEAAVAFLSERGCIRSVSGHPRYEPKETASA